jgi:hypothetical protein
MYCVMKKMIVFFKDITFLTVTTHADTIKSQLKIETDVDLFIRLSRDSIQYRTIVFKVLYVNPLLVRDVLNWMGISINTRFTIDQQILDCIKPSPHAYRTDAIKLYQNLTGHSLMESIRYVDELIEKFDDSEKTT